MNKKGFDLHFAIAAILIFAAAMTRLIPKSDFFMNFTPIIAIGLFGAAYFKDMKWAYIIPLSSMLISDILLGLRAGDMTQGILHPAVLAVYGSIAIAILAGKSILKKVSVTRIIGASLTGSVIFYILTNFAAWLDPKMGYAMTFSGFLFCYDMALPFFRNMIIGDLAFCAIMFGAFELSKAKLPALSRAKS